MSISADALAVLKAQLERAEDEMGELQDTQRRSLLREHSGLRWTMRWTK